MARASHATRAMLGALAIAAAAPVPLAAQARVATEPEAAQTVAAVERRARLVVRDMPLAEALTQLHRTSGVPVSFSPSLLPRNLQVSCDCDAVTIATALDRLLRSTPLRYREIDGHVLVYRLADVTRPRLLDLSVPRMYAAAGPGPQAGSPAEAAEPVRVGVITGQVTDADSGRPLANVQVTVDGAGRAITDREGNYRIANVQPGRRTVGVTSIGYRRHTQEVDVATGEVVTLNIALEISPAQLDAVVVTVTGEQRVRELGHVVGRIDADSVVRASPVSTVTELLTSRVPGMQVTTAQGTVGGDAAIRIRGATTTALGRDPIVIVDGIRYSNARTLSGGTFGTHEPTNRLNDISPNDIESIEVVKGPSAATLYGTDAANGVIVITTKRGREGPARWSSYVRTTASEIPTETVPDAYRGISSTVPNCTLLMAARDQCVQEGVERIPSPLKDPELTFFSSAPRWEVGANVAGGNAGMRYYLSADYEDATGPVRIPRAAVEQLLDERGVASLPPEQMRPNALTKMNVRSNVSMNLNPASTAQISVGYTQSDTRSLNVVQSPFANGVFNGNPENPYGGFPPERAFSMTSNERLNRLTGALRADAQVMPWLSSWAAVGLDLSNTTRTGLSLPGQGAASARVGGAATDIRGRNSLMSVELGSRSTVQLSEVVASRTAIGAQYLRSFNDRLIANGTGLPPGGRTPATAANRTITSSQAETVTLGAYMEQTFSLSSRLYLTGALRADGASTFGRDYSVAMYPKASASWIVSDEPFFVKVPGVSEARVRLAYGASGRQPTTAMALPGFIRGNAYVDGVTHTSVWQNGLGNPDLRPERTRELEYGLDIEALGDRAQIELTWYRRNTVDGLQSAALQPGFGNMWINVGEVDDRGFEAQVSLRPLDRRLLSWDVTLLHSTNTNRLVSLGDASPTYSVNGGMVEGYPVGARFMTPLVGWDDANGDGVIERNEVLMASEPAYVGRSEPRNVQTLHTALGFFDQRVRATGMLDRQSGFVHYDNATYNQCYNGYCRALVDPATSLSEQAHTVAATNFLSAPGYTGTSYVFLSPADLVRLREVALTFAIPTNLTGRLRLRGATASVQARNLALWTRFAGIDPESVVGLGGYTGGYNGTPTGIPQARTWVIRIDIDY